MTILNHILTLKKKHALLQQEINTCERTLVPNDIHLHDLKKQKLKIKDDLLKYPEHS